MVVRGVFDDVLDFVYKLTKPKDDSRQLIIEVRNMTVVQLNKDSWPKVQICNYSFMQHSHLFDSSSSLLLQQCQIVMMMF